MDETNKPPEGDIAPSLEPPKAKPDISVNVCAVVVGVGMIVGGALAGTNDSMILGGLIVALAVFFIWRRRRRG